MVVLCDVQHRRTFLCCQHDAQVGIQRLVRDDHPNRGGRGMKPLSEQLSDLEDRAKQAEDTVAAARAKNRAALESQRERLKSSIDAAKARGEARTAAAEDDVQSWWDETRSNINDRFEALQAERDQHRAERDFQKAENRADDAELRCYGRDRLRLLRPRRSRIRRRRRRHHSSRCRRPCSATKLSKLLDARLLRLDAAFIGCGRIRTSRSRWVRRRDPPLLPSAPGPQEVPDSPGAAVGPSCRSSDSAGRS